MSGTSRDSNPAGQCCSTAHLVQCEPDEASSFTNPNVGPGTYASLRLKLDAWSSAVHGGQRRPKCSSPTRSLELDIHGSVKCICIGCLEEIDINFVEKKTKSAIHLIEILKMERRAFMLFHFVGLALFTQTFASNLNEVSVTIPQNSVDLKIRCENNTKIFQEKITIQCKHFWIAPIFIIIWGNKSVSTEKVIFESGTNRHEAKFVKSFLKAQFVYILPGKTKWRMEVVTANRSANILGRIYFSTNCSTAKSLVSLANSFDNFTPGKTDIFNFNAPSITDDHFCVSIQNKEPEKWVLKSITLHKLNVTEKYVFNHGEEMVWQRYNRYQGSNPFEWKVVVVTGKKGTDIGVDITFNGLNCDSLITLDNEFDNFMVNGTDEFEVRAKSCGKLKSIQLKCQRECNWIMKNITVTGITNSSLIYTFTHGERLVGSQTFFTSQKSGPNKWDVFVCTKTSTDHEIYLQLHGKKNVTAKVRLTTPEDDFEAGQCNNFTLYLQDIGDLQKIFMYKPDDLKVNKLLIRNDKTKYQFHLLGAIQSRYTMIAYRTDFLSPKLNNTDVTIDLIDNFMIIGVTVKPATYLEAHIKRGNNSQSRTLDTCFAYILVNDYMKCTQPIKGQYVNFKLNIHPIDVKLTVRPEPGKTIWYLDIQLPIVVKNAYIRLEDNKLSTFISYISTMTKSISTHFYTEDILFSNANTLTLITELSNISCGNISVRLVKVKNHEIMTSNAQVTQFKCGWNFQFIPLLSSTTTVPLKTLSTTATIETTKWHTTGKETSISTRTVTKTKSTENSGTDATLVYSTGYHISYPVENRSVKNTTIWNSITPELSTVSSTTKVSTTHLDTENKTRSFSCICPKRNFTKTELAARLKELVKELKVNRNETTSYLRSKISAPDERVSSQVIGSTAVILMSVPFGLIFLVDLIPFLSFIYKKAVSFM